MIDGSDSYLFFCTIACGQRSTINVEEQLSNLRITRPLCVVSWHNNALSHQHCCLNWSEQVKLIFSLASYSLLWEMELCSQVSQRYPEPHDWRSSVSNDRCLEKGTRSRIRWRHKQHLVNSTPVHKTNPTRHYIWRQHLQHLRGQYPSSLFLQPRPHSCGRNNTE